MKRIWQWTDRRIGDIFFVNDPSSWLSNAIVEAEIAINPITPAHWWVPSHTGAFGPTPGKVVEAWMNEHEDSAAAVNDEAKYDGAFAAGRMQIWRPDFTETVAQEAIDTLVRSFGGESYGLLNLLGFAYQAFVAWLDRSRKVDNPIDHSAVCSQTMYAYLTIGHTLGGGEGWITDVKIENVSPDVLLMDCQQHQNIP